MTIVNNLLGGGVPTGKLDEYGLPIAPMPSVDECSGRGDHVSREPFLEALERVYPGKFIVSRDADQHDTPDAFFYNPELEPIEAGWKRGLYTMEAALSTARVSIMVRKMHADVELQFYIADMDETAEAWRSPTIVASAANEGIKRVFEFDEVIFDERHAMFVEVMTAPEDWDCHCPLFVEAHATTRDDCHEDWAGACIANGEGTRGIE